MNAWWLAARCWLARFPQFRRVLESLYRLSCRRELSKFDSGDAVQKQRQNLLYLVRQGQATVFGREHDFGRIRTIADFRRLVPLRSAADLRRFPNPPICLEADAARRSAVASALALAAAARPRCRLLEGSIVLLGDDYLLPDDPARILPSALLPVANRRGRVSCLVGAADRLARFLDTCKADDRVSPLAVLYTPSPGVSVERLRHRVGPEVLLLQLHFGAEAAIAVDDPRCRLPRLLLAHGTFFEFIPFSERQRSSPTRLGIDDLEIETTYELVVTAPGGWWACRTGTGIRLARRRPALVEFVPLPSVAVEKVPAVVMCGDAARTAPAAPRWALEYAESGASRPFRLTPSVPPKSPLSLTLFHRNS